MRGGRGRGGGRGGGGRGAFDLLAQTGSELGIYSLYQHTHVEKPPPLFPEQAIKKFAWSAGGAERYYEQFMILQARDLREATRASAFNLDSMFADAEEGTVATTGAVGTASGHSIPVMPCEGARHAHRRLVDTLGDALHSHMFPREIAERRAGKKRSRAAMEGGAAAGAGAGAGVRHGRERQNSVTDGLDELEKREAAADGAEGGAEGDGEGAGGGPPMRRRRIEDGDELEEEEEEEEEEEDYNDYAEAHDDGDDMEDSEGGDGGDY